MAAFEMSGGHSNDGCKGFARFFSHFRDFGDRIPRGEDAAEAGGQQQIAGFDVGVVWQVGEF